MAWIGAVFCCPPDCNRLFIFFFDSCGLSLSTMRMISCCIKYTSYDVSLMDFADLAEAQGPARPCQIKQAPMPLHLLHRVLFNMQRAAYSIHAFSAPPAFTSQITCAFPTMREAKLQISKSADLEGAGCMAAVELYRNSHTLGQQVSISRARAGVESALLDWQRAAS